MKVRIQVSFNIETDGIFEAVASAVHDATGRVKRLSDSYPHGEIGDIRILGDEVEERDEKRGEPTAERIG